MEAAEEKKQWGMCVFCGAQMGFGDRARGLVEKWVAEGRTTREEAEAYVYHGNIYKECPNAKEHGDKPMVPFGQLEHGAYYHGSCRNAHVARWNANQQLFVYMRQKFGHVYPEEIGYWVEAKPGEHRFDEFKPYGKLAVPVFEIPLV